ncbi:MAG: ECF transporter S component, partial [Desulfobacterales bacterium]|nr:ECF transporter S component [Desulfobacterales bacterium]
MSLLSDNTPDRSSVSVKEVAFTAIFIALSAVGAMIKIPSPVGTIGLDSGPGYFCGLAFGYRTGSLVIFIGHLLTAGIVG